MRPLFLFSLSPTSASNLLCYCYVSRVHYSLHLPPSLPIYLSLCLSHISIPIRLKLQDSTNVLFKLILHNILHNCIYYNIPFIFIFTLHFLLLMFNLKIFNKYLCDCHVSNVVRDLVGVCEFVL